MGVIVEAVRQKPSSGLGDARPGGLSSLGLLHAHVRILLVRCSISGDTRVSSAESARAITSPCAAGCGDCNAIIPTMDSFSRVATAATAYFAWVFAAGFVLGTARTLWIEPALGTLTAVLLELPLMIGVSWWACRWMLRRWQPPPGPAAAIGAMAFVLLMAAEAALSLTLAGRTLAEHVARYAELPHQLGLAAQLVFAALPGWLGRRPGR
jgi:hypothetical protein